MIFIGLIDTQNKTRYVNVSHIVQVVKFPDSENLRIQLSSLEQFDVNIKFDDFNALKDAAISKHNQSKL
jgi:hypothetical protein